MRFSSFNSQFNSPVTPVRNQHSNRSDIGEALVEARRSAAKSNAHLGELATNLSQLSLLQNQSLRAMDEMRNDVNRHETDIASDPPIVEAIPTTVPGLNNERDLNNESVEIENPSDVAILYGCGFAGCIVGGPFLALITTFVGNWAKNKEGPLGESTRAIGLVAGAAGKKAKDEHLFRKLKESVASLFGRNRTRSGS